MADEPLGLSHTILGMMTTLVGTIVVMLRKGNRLHRTLGIVYVASLVATNITALLIYDLTGHFNFFHASALFSLGVTSVGIVPALVHRPRANLGWLYLHAYFVSGSYVGVMAAFFAEIAVRVPGVNFGVATASATALVTAIGVYLIVTRVPLAIDNLKRRPKQSARGNRSQH
jgi:uncharacterized membrane protein